LHIPVTGQSARRRIFISTYRSHRAPTAELPTTAALMGGLVAQEAIKVITRQYVPVDGTCVVDLIASTTTTIKV
jgi:hypothetical protein